MRRLVATAILGGLLLGFGLVLGVVAWVVPQMPPTARLQEVRFQTPLRVYTEAGELVAEFGEKRRTPVALSEVPLQVRQAFLAAEDDRFYEHPGVDWMAIVRAAVAVALSRERSQGGSTITMQVARNFFLTREKTYRRKLREVALSFKIERELTKDQIFELYLNKIFLGNRAYGVAAAAQVYFGKELGALDLAEAALIAGLPKAPSRLNPVADPTAAGGRRHYVLSRMRELDFISEAEFAAADASPLPTRLHGQPIEVEAPHLAEMIRETLVAKFGRAAYTRGYRVYTPLRADAQRAALKALRAAVDTYDRRHGYRGPEGHVEMGNDGPVDGVAGLAGRSASGPLLPGIVVDVEPRAIAVLDERGHTRRVGWAGLSWARAARSEGGLGPAPTKAADIVRVGDIVRISRREKALRATDTPETASAWRLSQIPVAEGALVALDPSRGAIVALAGGYDFARSKFNRITQALRQPGSNFKPFIYSAALANGYTPASEVNDAPIVFEAPGLDEAWRPENYSGTYYGPTPLREALAHSRNLVSIRMMREMGVETVLHHVERFGFDPSRLPQNLSLALGSGEVTPLQVARGYAVFANGGFLIEPWFISRIETAEGTVVETHVPVTACLECEGITGGEENEPADLDALRASSNTTPARPAPRVIDARNAWLMYSMMKDVITRGTARSALVLGRTDLAGKTGTTNDLKDAWFSGFNADLVATAWIGLDDSRTLGDGETGARTALPMWIDFMRAALAERPAAELPQPAGLVTVRIADDAKGRPRYETFRAEDAPSTTAPTVGAPSATPVPADRAVEQLF